MKKSFTALVAIGALSLAACGGVDRDGSRDQFIKDLKEQLNLDADPDCVDRVLDDYSDDQLEDFDNATPDDPAAAAAFGEKLFACVIPEGG